MGWARHQTAHRRVSPGEASARLMAVRESAARDSMLRDLCDCIAHEVRDRKGTYSVRYVTRFVRRLKSMADRGTAVLIEPYWPIAVIITQILTIARENNVDYDEFAVRQGGELLANRIGMAINGTQFRIAGVDATTRQDPAEGPRLEVRLSEPYAGTLTHLRSDMTISLPMLLTANQPQVSPSAFEAQAATSRGLTTFLGHPH